MNPVGRRSFAKGLGYYTWDKHGKDKNLKLLNIAKLDKVLESNYNVILVLEGEQIWWKEKRENFFGLKHIDLVQ